MERLRKWHVRRYFKHYTKEVEGIKEAGLFKGEHLLYPRREQE